MKKTQSPTRPADDKTPFPLPEPMELAKLAAILRPDFSRAADALAVVIEWYFEAVLFCRELPSDSDELFGKFASHERQDARTYAPFQAKQDRAWNETLLLDPSQSNDAVRSYLQRNGVRHFSRAESVLKKVQGISQYIMEAKARPSRSHSIPDELAHSVITDELGRFMTADELLRKCKELENGKIAIPIVMLDTIVRFEKDRRQQQKYRSRQKQLGKPSSKIRQKKS
jgi:hypothetical protein